MEQDDGRPATGRDGIAKRESIETSFQHQERMGRAAGAAAAVWSGLHPVPTGKGGEFLHSRVTAWKLWWNVVRMSPREVQLI